MLLPVLVTLMTPRDHCWPVYSRFHIWSYLFSAQDTDHTRYLDHIRRKIEVIRHKYHPYLIRNRSRKLMHHRKGLTYLIDVVICMCLSTICTVIVHLPQAVGIADPFTLPIVGKPRVIHPFSPGIHHWDSAHRGVDLALPHDGDGAVNVYASGSGVVAFCGSINGINIISVRHPQGFITTYQPVLCQLPHGSYVVKGQLIGIISGNITHCAQCLHWGARYFHGHQSIYFDPLALIGRAHIRLKPTTSEK